jgi:hypothetical protein
VKIISVERGDRPATMTRARIIAPQAVKFLSSLLEDEAFADKAAIVIDWRGDMAWSGEGEMPDDLKQPALLIEVTKTYPGVGTLTVPWILDLEDLFGQDNATSNDLYEIVNVLRERVFSEEQRKGIAHGS